MTENVDIGKQVVVVSNPLISASYKLDTIAQKLIRQLVSMIKPDDDHFEKKFYRISVADFVKLTKSENRNVYNQVKEAARKLKKVSITIKKQKSTIETNWIASFEYHDGDGWIEFEFSSKLESELLLIKEQFTKYHLENVSKLKSQYSIRIYEIIKQYLPIGSRKIFIKDLKPILGIDETEYQRYLHFRQRVLEPAYKEINLKTDLSYQWRPIKDVRKIIGIEFYDIQQKITIPKELLDILPKKYRENKDVITNIRKWFELNGHDYVKEKILYTISRKPSKWADYFYQCLENDYGAGYDPAQAELPLEDEETKIILQDGVKIEIDGVVYEIKDGVVRTERGVIPLGLIRQGISKAEMKIIDV